MKPTIFAIILATMATVSGNTVAADDGDPLEGFNRTMFGLNEAIDTVAFRPAAKAYDAVMPDIAKQGVSNVFGNVGDVMTDVNNLLQGKPGDAFSDWGRFLLNSTVGIYGLFDVASKVGLEKHDEDSGQTLGKWGVGSGSYLVLPILGPSSFRDGAGWVVDIATDPVAHVTGVPERNSLLALRFIDTRSDLLPADKVIEEAALDKYSYVRDAYLNHRRNKVYDGNAPRVREDFE